MAYFQPLNICFNTQHVQTHRHGFSQASREVELRQGHEARYVPGVLLIHRDLLGRLPANLQSDLFRHALCLVGESDRLTEADTLLPRCLAVV